MTPRDYTLKKVRRSRVGLSEREFIFCWVPCANMVGSENKNIFD